MKMSVLYYTRTGHTKTMAETIAEGMRRVDGVETGVFSIDAIDEGFIKESQCVVLGSPVYIATIAAEVKTWFDKSAGKLGLAGKIGGAFATQDYLHGGGDIAIQSILAHMMVFGMMTYSGGGAHGKPVIHLGPVALGSDMDGSKETFLLYGERMAKQTAALFGSK
ncbi:MAG: NAD(P)H-dependent oxidoreductase [Planctomycetaceae bacterium]|nr:NAD(P)H-dependent oxidoreductase [Planctomycetaceae bacterium]